MRVLLIDGLGLAYRHFFARLGSPIRDELGRNVSAVVGVRHALEQLRELVRPDAWCMAWETAGPKRRHQLFPQYKADRSEKPIELLAQLPSVLEMAFFDYGLPACQVAGEEADDVIATLAHKAVAAGHSVAIHSADKDLLQLVGDRVTVAAPLSGGRHEIFDTDTVVEKWGVRPFELRHVLALMGDASDGYSGAAGIGRVTAVGLIRKHGTIGELYRQIDNLPPDVAKKLRSSERAVSLALNLATLHADLPVGLEALAMLPQAHEVADLPE